MRQELDPILIVDDDPGQRSLLEAFLRVQGYRTQTAASGEEALKVLGEKTFALAISDVRMPGISGLEMLGRIRRQHAHLPVLLVTAYADIRSAVAAMRDGAVSYIAKPIDLDELTATVRLATDGGRPPQPGPERKIGGLPPGVVAASPAMEAVYRDAAAVAAAAARILITGESGVGKEVVADLMHLWGPRASRPFVKVNCAAIPESLIESELFGHEKGSFTGATRQRIGRFEEANGGMILLDEISELPVLLQAKLLRVLHDGTFQRIGSNRTLLTDAWVVSATNRDMDGQIAAGKFREDLLYRLNVIEIRVPPLRDRPEEILPLAVHFIGRFSQQRSRFSAAASECLMKYRWPGNVRELRNAMERAALLSQSAVVLPEHLPARVAAAAASRPIEPIEAARLDEIERDAILKSLRKNGYNRTETAKELAISRRALTYKLQRLRNAGVPIESGEAGAKVPGGPAGPPSETRFG
jgi:DNA-binding NtrC family response regulator